MKNSNSLDVVLNMEATRKNLNDDTELVRALALIVIEDLPKLCSELQAAAYANDRLAVRQASHTIKGMAANFGAQPLIDLARQVEAEHESLNYETLAALVVSICKFGDNTILALQRELDFL